LPYKTRETMKRAIPMMIIALAFIAGCKQKQEQVMINDNPFFQEWNTPFEAPPFDLIRSEHFMPAFMEGMKLHSSEIDSIANNPEAATFANTLEAMEYSGIMLRRTSMVFDNLSQANTNDTIQKIAEDAAPLLSEHYDKIYLNEKLFTRVKSVFDQKETLNLNPEQLRLLEEKYEDFVYAGAKLDPAQKERLMAINKELSTKTLKFDNNLLAENNTFEMVLDKEEDLAGLPEGLRQGAAEAASEKGMDGKWVFSIKRPSIFPFLQYSSRRDLREKIYNAYINKGNNGDSLDNKALITEILNLRIEKAKLLGFDNWASLVLSRNMAKDPATVNIFLSELMQASTKKAKAEVIEMQKIIDREKGGFKLAPWDWFYYAEKVRIEKYALDEEALRPYFKLENVRDGVFDLVKRLWGISMERRNDVPVYHPDVEVYEVKNADGSHIGILYMDWFTRASKQGGAWMSEYRGQYMKDGKMVSPIITNVLNFNRPAEGKPALLNFDEVETLFHEFGHALHGLLSTCTYPSMAGTNVSRDFVELPSQIMENWCSEPEMLRLYARHWESGEVIPEELISKITNSSFFNQGFTMSEYMAASILDMNWHTLGSAFNGDIIQIEKELMSKAGLIEEIVPRYRSTYFAHIFAGGYSAGYYSYVWAQVLDADAFEAFKEKGIFDTATATLFRNNILSRGNTADPMELYKAFRGKEPNKEALLRRNGIIK
jgi:peptidyl-dipeptidase Dcp